MPAHLAAWHKLGVAAWLCGNALAWRVARQPSLASACGASACGSGESKYKAAAKSVIFYILAAQHQRKISWRCGAAHVALNGGASRQQRIAEITKAS